MIPPEHAVHTTPESPYQAEVRATLLYLQQQIERADAIENPIERERRLDTLLEQRDWLLAEDEQSKD